MGLSMFTCGRDCVDRKPGCHSHCEKYKRERAAYDKRKAELNKDREARRYTMQLLSDRANARAISGKTNGRRKLYHYK